MCSFKNLFSETHSSPFKILHPETEKMLRNKSNELYTWINTRVKNWTHFTGDHTSWSECASHTQILTVLLKSPWLLSTQRPTQRRQGGQGHWMHRGLPSQIWISTWLSNKISNSVYSKFSRNSFTTSVPLKVVLFLINATFILLVVQTRKLGVTCDCFISLNPIHGKIFLGSVSNMSRLQLFLTTCVTTTLDWATFIPKTSSLFYPFLMLPVYFQHRISL